MKRLGLALLALAIAAVLLPAAAFAHTAEDPYTTDLVYGRKMVDVGDVQVWNDANFLYVKYLVTKANWYLFESHLEVKTNVGSIPQSSGNAVPGHFTYKADHDSVTEYTYQVPVTWPVGTKLYIAAHGVVGKQGGSVADVCANLPAEVTEHAEYNGITSFFDTTVSGGTSLDGLYAGWCADQSLDSPAWYYPADVVCSYNLGALPAGLIDNPENLDLVNWILNQDYVGQGYSAYAVQVAIWTLLQDEPQATGPDIETILAAAHAQGEGFVPACNQNVVILLLPRDPISLTWLQPNLILKQVPCVQTCQETVWAKGKCFPGRNWSMYFNYTVQ